MDFRDDADAARFRSEFRAWLHDHVPRDAAPVGGPERARFWNDWHRALYAGGWMGLSWPVAYGGRGLDATYEAILNDEIGRAGAPPAPHVGFLGRALLHFGSEDQKRRFLPGLLSGDEIWCQGFSEPGAGSDLAAIATRAVVDGDHWSVNGQKIWTSDAAWADFCLLLARTDTDGPRHQGISALIVDMTAPGIEVRPIVQSNADTEFNEVFFTDVAVPIDDVIGSPGQGWAIAMTTVGYERGPADVGFSSRYVRTMGELVEQARGRDDLSEGERLAVARAHVEVEVLRVHVLRSLSARTDDVAPGAEGSVDKLLSTRAEQRLHHVAMDVHGRSALDGSAPAVLAEYLYSRAASIAGGTSQIQRDIVAQRLLGLPRAR
jgi:alkylation response protein AidB-like acyl-CoA dehydrogenase